MPSRGQPEKLDGPYVRPGAPPGYRHNPPPPAYDCRGVVGARGECSGAHGCGAPLGHCALRGWREPPRFYTQGEVDELRRQWEASAAVTAPSVLSDAEIARLRKAFAGPDAEPGLLQIAAGWVLALFSWRHVCARGAWRYEQNTRTGKRRAFKVHNNLVGPVDNGWLAGGTWTEAPTGGWTPPPARDC